MICFSQLAIYSIMSQAQSFPQSVEVTCVKVEGCRLERFSWEENDWWLIRQADDNQIKKKNWKRCTIRVGSIGCSGLVSLNLSTSIFPLFFPAGLVMTVSKIIERKGRLVFPNWAEMKAPVFLSWIILKQLRSVRPSEPIDHSSIRIFHKITPSFIFSLKLKGNDHMLVTHSSWGSNGNGKDWFRSSTRHTHCCKIWHYKKTLYKISAYKLKFPLKKGKERLM